MEANGDEDRDLAVRTALVPTPAGARYAVSSPAPDARRAILVGLLRSATYEPVALPALTAWTGLRDKKTLLALLFKMQRDGFLSTDARPLACDRNPLAQALPPLLQALSTEGRALLADDAGFPVAYAGYEPGVANGLAAIAAEAGRFYLSCARNVDTATLAGPWISISDGATATVAVAPLHVSGRRLHIAVAGAARTESDAFVQLTAELMRHGDGDDLMYEGPQSD